MLFSLLTRARQRIKLPFWARYDFLPFSAPPKTATLRGPIVSEQPQDLCEHLEHILTLSRTAQEQDLNTLHHLSLYRTILLTYIHAALCAPVAVFMRARAYVKALYTPSFFQSFHMDRTDSQHPLVPPIRAQDPIFGKALPPYDSYLCALQYQTNTQQHLTYAQHSAQNLPNSHCSVPLPRNIQRLQRYCNLKKHIHQLLTPRLTLKRSGTSTFRERIEHISGSNLLFFLLFPLAPLLFIPLVLLLLTALVAQCLAPLINVCILARLRHQQLHLLIERINLRHQSLQVAQGCAQSLNDLLNGGMPETPHKPPQTFQTAPFEHLLNALLTLTQLDAASTLQTLPQHLYPFLTSEDFHSQRPFKAWCLQFWHLNQPSQNHTTHESFYSILTYIYQTPLHHPVLHDSIDPRCAYKAPPIGSFDRLMDFLSFDCAHLQHYHLARLSALEHHEPPPGALYTRPPQSEGITPEGITHRYIFEHSEPLLDASYQYLHTAYYLYYEQRYGRYLHHLMIFLLQDALRQHCPTAYLGSQKTSVHERFEARSHFGWIHREQLSHLELHCLLTSSDPFFQHLHAFACLNDSLKTSLLATLFEPTWNHIKQLHQKHQLTEATFTSAFVFFALLMLYLYDPHAPSSHHHFVLHLQSRLTPYQNPLMPPLDQLQDSLTLPMERIMLPLNACLQALQARYVDTFNLIHQQQRELFEQLHSQFESYSLQACTALGGHPSSTRKTRL